MLLKLIYTLFLGLLVALFVGLGIDAFYPGPKAPDYPMELEITKAIPEEQEQSKETIKKYEAEMKIYEEAFKKYNRVVSMISLSFAIVIMIISLSFFSKIKMIADGVLLGGVFTTIYGIIRGLMSDDSRFRFLIVTVGLIIALVLGYIKFIRPKEKNNKE